MRSRYYISFNSGANWSEFWPSNEPKVSWAKESGEIFERYKVDTFKIGRTRNETVFDTIDGMFYDSTDFGTLVKYKINVLGVDKFFFIDSVTSGDMNKQNSVYESRPETDDSYRVIMQQYEKAWHRPKNIALTPTTNTYWWPDQLVGTDGLFTNLDFTVFTQSPTGHIHLHNTSSARQHAYKAIKDTAGADVQLLIGDLVVICISNYVNNGGANPNIDVTDVGYGSLAGFVTITGDGIYTLPLTGTAASEVIELSQTDDIAGTEISFDWKIYYFYFFHQSANGGLLNTVLNDVLNHATMINSGIGTPVSSYLWNDALPTGHAVDTPNVSTYFTANPTNDYVIEGSQNWNKIIISRGDDVTTPSEDFTFSLSDIMSVLKIKLRAFWFIDADGKFRIEHEKYFRDFIPQIDLTSVTYSGDKPEIDSKIYRYTRDELYYQLNYTESNAKNEDWTKYPYIEFDINKTSKQKKDINLIAGTDIQELAANPGADQKFILSRVVAFSTGYRVLIDMSNVTTGVYYPNAKMGWSYLFDNYFQYFAEADSGTVNNAAHTFDHVKEFLKQENIKFRMTSDLDWKKPITLSLGTGWIETTEYNPETGMYKLNVGLAPYEILITDIDSIISEDGLGLKAEDEKLLIHE